MYVFGVNYSSIHFDDEITQITGWSTEITDSCSVLQFDFNGNIKCNIIPTVFSRSQITAISVLDDDRIIIAFSNVDSLPYISVVISYPNGNIDSVSTRIFDEICETMKKESRINTIRQVGEWVYFGGFFTTIGEQEKPYYIIRVSKSGKMEIIPTDSTIITSSISCIESTPDSSIIVGSMNKIVKLQKDGNEDSVFKYIEVNNSIKKIFVLSNGFSLVSGSFYNAPHAHGLR